MGNIPVKLFLIWTSVSEDVVQSNSVWMDTHQDAERRPITIAHRVAFGSGELNSAPIVWNSQNLKDHVTCMS